MLCGALMTKQLPDAWPSWTPPLMAIPWMMKFRELSFALPTNRRTSLPLLMVERIFSPLPRMLPGLSGTRIVIVLDTVTDVVGSNMTD